MELIRDLEQRFQNLDATLNSREKVYAFYINFNNSYNRINTKIFNSLEEKKYENGLNECRDKMLKQLIQRRDVQLEEVNEFMLSSQQNSLSELERLHKSIKQNYSAFGKGLASVFESIMFRTKLSSPLKLSELGKYFDLMRCEENVCFAKVKHLLDLRFMYFRCFVHVLPSNLILSYCYHNKNMVVLNKSGDLIHLKKTQNGCYYEVQVNATNIVTYNKSNRIVDVYNFELELVHSIKLQREFYNFKLNNYEIALSTGYDADQLFITCYNYKTAQSKKKDICINTGELKNILGADYEEKDLFELVDLNDRFIFIQGYGSCDMTHRRITNYVFLLNRHDNNNLFKYLKSDLQSWFIYNNQIGCISSEFLQINEIDGSVQREPIKISSKIRDICSTSNDKFILSKRFDSINSILKFYLY